MKWLKYGLGGVLALLLIGAVTLYKGDIPAAEVDAKYSNPASRFLTTPSGARVHYRDEGRPDGQPVVLVHGANASLHTWEPWVEILGERYRVVTLDLPGHGLTGAVPDGDYSNDAQVAVVAAVTRHLGLTDFVLGGNSMGGGVTWRYALRNPEAVRAMILVDAVGLPQWQQDRFDAEPDTERERPLFFTLLSKPWFRAIARHLDPYRLAEQGARAAYNNSAVVDDALINRYYELNLRAGTRAAILQRFESFGRTRRSAPVDPMDLTQPTLILWGREDALVPVGVGEQFGATLPNNRLIIYDGVGHVPMEEIPTRSAADVLAFLQELPAT